MIIIQLFTNIIIFYRTCGIIKHWVENHWYDFEDNSELCDRLLYWLKNSLQNSEYSRFGTSIEKTILSKGSQGNLIRVVDSVPIPITPRTNNILDFSPIECARQLCLLEFEDFAQIHPTECVHQNWQKKDKKILSPNICKIIHRSNTIPMWIATQILTAGDQKIKTRAKLIIAFIKIAVVRIFSIPRVKAHPLT